MSNHNSGSHSSFGSHRGSDFGISRATGIRTGGPGSTIGASLHDDDSLFDKHRLNSRTSLRAGNLPGTANDPVAGVLTAALAMKMQNNTMFCKYCGTNISRDSKFCKKCGKQQQ